VTYALLGLVFVCLAVMLAALATPTLSRPGRWWSAVLVTGLVLVVLTAVFDNLMIAEGLFRYPRSALLGPRVALAPVEDFAWPVFAALALPALWELVAFAGGSRGRER
jgi:lycopene cyclase domain-containing protein